WGIRSCAGDSALQKGDHLAYLRHKTETGSVRAEITILQLHRDLLETVINVFGLLREPEGFRVDVGSLDDGLYCTHLLAEVFTKQDCQAERLLTTGASQTQGLERIGATIYTGTEEGGEDLDPKLFKHGGVSKKLA